MCLKRKNKKVNRFRRMRLRMNLKKQLKTRWSILMTLSTKTQILRVLYTIKKYSIWWKGMKKNSVKLSILYHTGNKRKNSRKINKNRLIIPKNLRMMTNHNQMKKSQIKRRLHKRNLVANKMIQMKNQILIKNHKNKKTKGTKKKIK